MSVSIHYICTIHGRYQPNAFGSCPECAAHSIVLPYPNAPEPAPIHDFVPRKMVDVRREHVERTLAHFKGKKAPAARALGVTLKTLYNWMIEFGFYETDALGYNRKKA